MVRLLEDGDVEGDGGGAQEGLAEGNDAIDAGGLGERGRGGGEEVGGQGLGLGQQHLRLEQEDAGVPAVGGVGDIGLGGRQVGFLDEGGDLADRAGSGLGADVAVAGLGRGGRDAEDHQGSCLGGRRAGGDGGAQGGRVGHPGVGAEQQDELGAGLSGGQRGDHGGRAGVAALRLEDQQARGDIDGRQLFADQVGVGGVADHHRRGEGFAGEAHGGVLDQGARAAQGMELLGLGAARQGPEPRAGATGEQDGGDPGHVGASGNSANCGPSSPITSQLALEPTKMWPATAGPGSSSRAPAGTQ